MKRRKQSSYAFLLDGCGRAGQVVAQVAVKDGRGKIAGLVDTDTARLEEVGRRYPDAVTGTGFADTLERVRPDVVVIAGPDHLHADHAVLALEAGCHVFLEKPMATTVADARRIMDAAERAGKSVMTDQTVRYMYPWREMALAARNGQIGEVFFIQGDYIHDMWHYYDPQGKSHTPWRVDPLHPQNILLGGGCHPIDIMLWAMDRPVEEVFAVSNKMSAPMFPADDCYLVTLRFAGGAMGKVFVTSGCSIGEGAEQGPGGGYLAVYGTEGTLWRGKLYRRDQTARTLENTSEEYSVSGHGWGRSVVEFLDTIDGSMSNPIPPRESARTIAVCEAAFISIRTGKPEKPLWPDSDGIQ